MCRREMPKANLRFEDIIMEFITKANERNVTTMKKAITIILALVVLLGIMYGEYRYIMTNICPYKGDNGTVYLEIFGQVDEYYADPVSEMEN